MPLILDDIIVAPVTASGAAERAIIRLSGAGLASLLHSVFVPAEATSWGTSKLPRRHVGTVVLPRFSSPLPVSLFFWPGRRSYTGEPMAEFHLVGSSPLVAALLSRLLSSGARMARPGEFTQRAFLAGRIDLTQAEAVLGVIDAETQPELKAALTQMAGGLSGPVGQIQSDLLNLLADLEAGLDFVEEDIEFVGREEICRHISAAKSQLSELLELAITRTRGSERWRVVLAGLPNAGKSTLFNALLESSLAIVSDQSGTTRDYLAREVDWHGVPIELIDTAGREQEWGNGAGKNSSEEAVLSISAHAQQVCAEQISRADLILWCRAINLAEDERSRDALIRATTLPSTVPQFLVLTKSDLCEMPTSSQTLAYESREDADHSCVVSATTGHGLDSLKETVARHWMKSPAPRTMTDHPKEGGGVRAIVGTTLIRCRESLSQSHESLHRALSTLQSGYGDELVALELRGAVEQLGMILGTVYTDDILDRVFSRFCIGK